MTLGGETAGLSPESHLHSIWVYGLLTETSFVSVASCQIATVLLCVIQNHGASSPRCGPLFQALQLLPLLVFFQSHWLGLLRVLFCLPLVTSMSKCLGPCSFYPLLQFCHITLKATCILMTGMCISVALRGVLIICPAASPMVPLLCLIRVWNVLYRKDDSHPP